MRSSSAGLLLLLVGAMGLIGFLTGNLDRWLGYLFSPGKPALASGTASGMVPGSAPLPTAGGSAQRQSA